MPNGYQSERWTGPQLDQIYPIGSIYMSVTSTDPGTLFGGTWEQIQNTFLVAQGSSYTAGSTGGNATHSHTTNAGTSGGPSNNTSGSTAITISQMPSHGHVVRLHNQAGTQGTAYVYNGATKTNSTWAKNTGVSWVGSTFNCAQGGAGDQCGGADPVGNGAGHTHTLSSHTHSQVSVGTSSASNLPPYLAVYMWKRTA